MIHSYNLSPRQRLVDPWGSTTIQLGPLGKFQSNERSPKQGRWCLKSDTHTYTHSTPHTHMHTQHTQICIRSIQTHTCTHSTDTHMHAQHPNIHMHKRTQFNSECSYWVLHCVSIWETGQSAVRPWAWLSCCAEATFPSASCSHQLFVSVCMLNSMENTNNLYSEILRVFKCQGCPSFLLFLHGGGWTLPPLAYLWCSGVPAYPTSFISKGPIYNAGFSATFHLKSMKNQ